MAEKARYYLERSIPELADLQKKELFDENEVKQIVKKRTLFETLLARRQPVKKDFLRYIEHEENLENLRKLRAKRKNTKTKSGPSDYGARRRILFIYKRATSRFQGDIDLWLAYINYAKRERATRALSTIFTEAIQHHPTRPIFWIEASFYDFYDNGNITAARSLMQRGLRLCKNSVQLWTEYFRLEVVFVIKLLARREALKISDAQSGNQSVEDLREQMEQDESGTIRLPKELELMDGQDTLDPNSPQMQAHEQILKGAIPEAIFESSIQHVPETGILIGSLVAVCEDYVHWDFVSNLLDKVIQQAVALGIHSAYVEFEVSWAPVRKATTVQDTAAAMKTLAEEVNRISQMDMSVPDRVRFTALLSEQLTPLVSSGETPDALKVVASAILIALYTAAESSNCATNAQIEHWAKLLEESGRKDAADGVIARAQIKKT